MGIAEAAPIFYRGHCLENEGLLDKILSKDEAKGRWLFKYHSDPYNDARENPGLSRQFYLLASV